MSTNRNAYIILEEADAAEVILAGELSLMGILTRVLTDKDRRAAIIRQMEATFEGTPEQLALIGHLEGLSQHLFDLAKQ